MGLIVCYGKGGGAGARGRGFATYISLLPENPPALGLMTNEIVFSYNLHCHCDQIRQSD